MSRRGEYSHFAPAMAYVGHRPYFRLQRVCRNQLSGSSGSSIGISPRTLDSDIIYVHPTGFLSVAVQYALAGVVRPHSVRHRFLTYPAHSLFRRGAFWGIVLYFGGYGNSRFRNDSAWFLFSYSVGDAFHHYPPTRPACTAAGNRRRQVEMDSNSHDYSHPCRRIRARRTSGTHRWNCFPTLPDSDKKMARTEARNL